jgi:hypothetical protein
MGLDMYLNAKRFLWSSEVELSKQISNAFPELGERRVKEVTVEAIYWRKSNMIHKWFVDNVQGGTDDCGNYHVSREDLEVLRQLILEALDKKDATLLPPTAGFFFGSDKVDEWYWDDLRRTEADIVYALRDFDETGWSFEYHSSW